MTARLLLLTVLALAAGCAEQRQAPSGPASLQVVSPDYYSRALPRPLRRMPPVDSPRPPAQPMQRQDAPATTPDAAARSISDKADEIAEQLRTLQLQMIRLPPRRSEYGRDG